MSFLHGGQCLLHFSIANPVPTLKRQSPLLCQISVLLGSFALALVHVQAEFNHDQGLPIAAQPVALVPSSLASVPAAIAHLLLHLPACKKGLPLLPKLLLLLLL